MNVRFTSAALTLAALLCSLGAIAQTPAATPSAPASMPACDGNLAIVRVSEIKPGSMDKFLAAVAAHQAWYRNNGATNHIFVARVIVENPDTHQFSYSDNQVLTYNINPPRTASLPRNDAAWKAYVQMYRDSSDIKTTYMTCMPKGAY